MKEGLAMAAKRQRLSADETRERLLQAGMDSLAKAGIAVGLDAINLEQAVRDADVSRSSAYGIWSEDDEFSPQEHFQRAVLLRALGKRAVAARVFAERMSEVNVEHGETMTREELQREIIRVVAGHHVEEIGKIGEWRIVIALRAILLSTPEENRDQRLLSLLHSSEKAGRVEAIEMLFRPAMKLLGLVPRPEFGDAAFDYIEAASASITEGLATRAALNADSLAGNSLTNPADGSTGWSIYTLALERFVDIFFVAADEASR